MAELSTVAFGRYLRELRERRGLSLMQVCELSKRTLEPFYKGTLSKLERGKQAPSIFRLGPLTRIYEISADALLERMELDTEVERVGAPDTDNLTFEALRDAGAEALQKSSRKLHAYAYLREAERVAPPEQKTGAWLNLVTAIRSLGKIALALHELQALESSPSLAPIERVWIHERLANCARCLGEMDRAERHGDIAIVQAQALGDLRTLAYAYATRAYVALDQDQWVVANEGCIKALESYRHASGQDSRMQPSPSFEVQCLFTVAECSFRLGNSSRTRHFATTAKKLAQEHEFVQGVGYAEIALGWLDDAEGQRAHAEARWRSAVDIATAIDHPQMAFAAEVELFRQAREHGEVMKAEACRRRLERLLPWISRHKPAYRRFKELIGAATSHDERDEQGGGHEEQKQMAVGGVADGARPRVDRPEQRGRRAGESRTGRLGRPDRVS